MPVETAAPETALSREEILRYSRHLIIPEVGVDGQVKLKQAKVLLVGAGGLGSPLALYLAAAGVGRLGVVDFDVVDASNLQRQVLHGTGDIGRKKLDSAVEAIAELNPGVSVDRYDTALSSQNALAILRDYDMVVDGTDNFPTRYLVNDACVLLGKPNVYGSIFRFEGQASVFKPGDGPCYRCVFPEPTPSELAPSCDEAGVLGVLPGTIGIGFHANQPDTILTANLYCRRWIVVARILAATQRQRNRGHDGNQHGQLQQARDEPDGPLQRYDPLETGNRVELAEIRRVKVRMEVVDLGGSDCLVNLADLHQGQT